MKTVYKIKIFVGNGEHEMRIKENFNSEEEAKDAMKKMMEDEKIIQENPYFIIEKCYTI